MSTLTSDEVWRTRFEEIDSEVKDLRFPDPTKLDKELDQDQEWCEVLVNGKYQRIRFHDYDEIYRVPGLYEQLFYDKLECCSPSYIVNLLEDVVREQGADLNEFKVFDVGAGNGMVGDELTEKGVDGIIGIDIIPEAREAAERDRPDIYDTYVVGDLTKLPERPEQAIRKLEPDCLTTVAALGYGDIPPAAFLKAVSLLSTPAWLAFNLKQDFLREGESSGFARLVTQLSREEFIQIQCYRRYRHRNSVLGRPLHYVAMVAKKLRDIPPEFLRRSLNS